jgi:hypothetical protein
MTQTSEQKRALKETLKSLRAERAGIVETATQQNKQRLAARRKIRTELAKGPATVPALAGACGLTPREVLWHVAAMRKYGELTEDAQDGDYFTYRLVQGKGRGD